MSRIMKVIFYNIVYLRINEKEIIVNLMSVIFQYENKINNLLMNINTDMNKNYMELSNLKKNKIIYQEKISE